MMKNPSLVHRKLPSITQEVTTPPPNGLDNGLEQLEDLLPEIPKDQATLFKNLNNLAKRLILGSFLASLYVGTIYAGPLALIFATICCQVLCFSEVIAIGYNYNKLYSSVPYFTTPSWYSLFAANFFFFGEIISPHFQHLYQNAAILKWHRFTSFCVYLVGLLLFVSTLVRKYDSIQFSIFARTHILCLLMVLESYLVIENIFQGLIWYVLPISLVVLNDIFAYLSGKLWGKTPLIEVSPKKTWEGFIGGAIGTVISGYFVMDILCSFKYFTCPLEYTFSENTSFFPRLKSECELSPLFKPVTYSSSYISWRYYPFIWHFLAFALFASIVAPFGGFCASGFKRAFKVKDFGRLIPGHGGLTDRCDCLFMMANFVYVYVFTFVGNPTVDLLFHKILYLDDNKQVEFYNLLRNSLQNDGFKV